MNTLPFGQDLNEDQINQVKEHFNVSFEAPNTKRRIPSSYYFGNGVRSEKFSTITTINYCYKEEKGISYYFEWSWEWRNVF